MRHGQLLSPMGVRLRTTSAQIHAGQSRKRSVPQRTDDACGAGSGRERRPDSRKPEGDCGENARDCAAPARRALAWRALAAGAHSEPRATQLLPRYSVNGALPLLVLSRRCSVARVSRKCHPVGFVTKSSLCCLRALISIFLTASIYQVMCCCFT